MKPLDQIKPGLLLEAQVNGFLSPSEQAKFQEIPEEERYQQYVNLLVKPIAHFSVINELYFRSRWAELIHHFYGTKPISLLEVASGDADMIVQAISRSNPDSRYITANMNKLLNDSMLRKTEGLPVKLELIDDDASLITDYIPSDSVDIVAFQHAVNDVLQAILCSQHGIDTVYSDWMGILPQMIKLLQAETADNTLEASVKEPFLALIKNMLQVLKPGGVIAVNHYMFQLDLDWGYPADLFENMLLMIRPWLTQLQGCTEFYMDGFDPQWWLFLRKEQV